MMMLTRRLRRAFDARVRDGLCSADNFVSNPGTGGSTFASDDISSVHYSRIKLIHGADGVNAGDVATANPLPVQMLAVATNGCDTFRSIDLDETHESIKASAGTLYGIWFSNTAATTLFLHIYDHASPTVGTTTPKITIALPGNSSDDVSGVANLPQGIAFGTAITAAATTAVGGTGAPGTNECLFNAFYK